MKTTHVLPLLVLALSGCGAEDPCPKTSGTSAIFIPLAPCPSASV